MRDFTSMVQQSVSERTAKLNKEAQPRSAILLDASVPHASSSTKPGARAQQSKLTATAKSALPSAAAGAVRPSESRVQVFTPPKSDGSPSSATSGSRDPKHPIPDTFGTLDLSIPNRWDGQIPIPVRIIHWAALKTKTEAELLSHAVSKSEVEEGRRAISIVSLRLRRTIHATTLDSCAKPKKTAPCLCETKPFTICDPGHGSTTHLQTGPRSQNLRALHCESWDTTTRMKRGRTCASQVDGQIHGGTLRKASSTIAKRSSEEPPA